VVLLASQEGFCSMEWNTTPLPFSTQQSLLQACSVSFSFTQFISVSVNLWDAVIFWMTKNH